MKILKSAFCAAIIICVIFALAACGDQASLVGRWMSEPPAVKDDGGDGEVYDIASSFTKVWDIKDNGTIVETITYDDGYSMSSNYTYTVSGDKIILTWVSDVPLSEGDEIAPVEYAFALTSDGKQLTLVAEGITTVFVKA